MHDFGVINGVMETVGARTTVSIKGVEVEFWRSVRIVAIAKGMTMKAFILRALRKAIEGEDVAALALKKRKRVRHERLKPETVEQSQEVRPASAGKPMSGCCGMAVIKAGTREICSECGEEA